MSAWLRIQIKMSIFRYAICQTKTEIIQINFVLCLSLSVRFVTTFGQLEMEIGFTWIDSTSFCSLCIYRTFATIHFCSNHAHVRTHIYLYISMCDMSSHAERNGTSTELMNQSKSYVCLM